MANTLTNLIPTLYSAMDVVSREMVGMIPSVDIDASASQASVGQLIVSPVSAGSEPTDIVPGGTSPNSGDQGFGNTGVSIEKSKMVPVNWTGEEELALGSSQTKMLIDQFAQAMRAITNEVEADLCALYRKASRAYGTAGVTPFGTPGDFEELAATIQILKDNGAPQGSIQTVINTSAGTKIIGKQSRADIIGTDDIRTLQQQGIILAIGGSPIRESAQVKYHTKGNGTAYVTSGSTAQGATNVALATGSNNVLSGDVVTFAADTANKYVVNTGIIAPGTMVIGKPGTRGVIPTGNALTVGNSYTANLVFARSAIKLLARVPAMPSTGDQADDVMTLTDPVSGLTFQIAMYKQYRRIHFEVGLAWGVGCVKAEHLAILIG